MEAGKHIHFSKLLHKTHFWPHTQKLPSAHKTLKVDSDLDSGAKKPDQDIPTVYH